jgi:hypothetical protein
MKRCRKAPFLITAGQFTACKCKDTEVFMSEVIEVEDSQLDEIGPVDKLSLLKMEATQLGIKFHPSIKEAKLKDKIQAYKKAAAKAAGTPKAIKEEVVSAGHTRRELKRKQLELVRIQVSPMNPHMKGLKGQIFTRQNALVGRVSQYIPFNSPHGWHVPRILVDDLESREYLTFYTWEDSKGREHKGHRLAKAYSITYMPPLTPEQVAQIKANIKVTEGHDGQ